MSRVEHILQPSSFPFPKFPPARPPQTSESQATFRPRAQPSPLAFKQASFPRWQPCRSTNECLQFEHIHFIKLPAYDGNWWPCLVFPNFDTMLRVYLEIFPGNPNAKIQLCMEFNQEAAKGQAQPLHCLEVILELGATHRSHYGLGNAERRRFDDLSFNFLLAKKKKESFENAPLEEALDQLLNIIERQEKKISTTTIRLPPVRTATSTVAPRSVARKNSSGSVTIVSHTEEEELSRKRIRTTVVAGTASLIGKRHAPTMNQEPEPRDPAEFEAPMPDDETDNNTVLEESTGVKIGRKRKASKISARLESEKEVTPAVAKTKSKPKRSPNIKYEETGETFEIPAWSEVKPLFEQLQYTFDDNLYCRPFGDPRKYNNVEENVDYFKTEDSFKKFLCSHGVEYVGALPWEDNDEREIKVTIWVRSAVVKSIENDSEIPELILGKSKGLRLLKALGIKYKHGILKEGYQLPGCAKGDTTLYEETELWDFLARHGLPEGCKFEKIDDRQRLALELFLATDAKRDSFFLSREENGLKSILREPSTGNGISEEQTLAHQEGNDLTRDRMMEPSPAVDHSALKASTRAPQHDGSPLFSPFARNLNFERHGEPLLPSLSASKDQEASDDAEKQVSYPNRAEHGDKHQQSSETNTSSVNEREHLGDGSKVSVDPVPEVFLKGKTISEKLRSCMNAMRKSSNDGMIVTPKLSTALTQIQAFVQAVIDSKGAHGSRGLPAFLHVCGAPGIGKSMGVKRCCDQARERSRKTSEDWVEEPKICTLNASVLQNLSKAQAIEKTLEHMGLKKNQLKRPANVEDSTKAAVILILDEIDLLVASKGAGNHSSGTEEFLRTLLDWVSDERMRFSLIGISNSVENYKARRLSALGMARSKVVFHTYCKDDLIQIIESRIGRSVVDPKMIEFIASKVAATSGDARKMLDLVSRTIEACRSKLSKSKMDSAFEGPVVKLPHAMIVIRETNTKYKDLIESLPSFEKYTLCVGVNLSRVLGKKPLTLGVLKSFSMEAFGFDSMMDAVSLEDFKGIIERLKDHGLLKMTENDSSDVYTENWNSLLNFPVCFDLQLEDVESALEETVLKEDFYQKIVARTKTLSIDSV